MMSKCHYYCSCPLLLLCSKPNVCHIPGSPTCQPNFNPHSVNDSADETYWSFSFSWLHVHVTSFQMENFALEWAEDWMAAYCFTFYFFYDDIFLQFSQFLTLCIIYINFIQETSIARLLGTTFSHCSFCYLFYAFLQVDSTRGGV